jgi:hypothetical protein
LNAQEHIKHNTKSNLVQSYPLAKFYSWEEEPSMELQFIQYPKFPHEEAELKKELIIRTELMMMELEQKGGNCFRRNDNARTIGLY